LFVNWLEWHGCTPAAAGAHDFRTNESRARRATGTATLRFVQETLFAIEDLVADGKNESAAALFTRQVTILHSL
jgi:hypothetical protein